MTTEINKVKISHPLCNGSLPTAGFCEAGRPPRLDEYKDYSDWVPVFYAPPQYHFCKAFDDWYYRSCVPATQEARDDLRDIAQKNGGDAASKKELTDQLSGTLERTEGACAGIAPDILKETADRCDTIIGIHNKNRIILGLGAFIMVKGLFTAHAVRHTTRSWNEMKTAFEKVRGEVKAARAEEGVWAAAKRLWKGIGQVWYARESDFREQVTDINILFAKLLEFAGSREEREAAVAKWNDVKVQKKLSAEKKFERFKEVIREEFGAGILNIIDELETDIVKEFIFQSGRLARLNELLTAGERTEALLLTGEISGPVSRLHETVGLLKRYAGLFRDEAEIQKRLTGLTDLTGDFVRVLRSLDDAIREDIILPTGGLGGRYDMRRLASIVDHASRIEGIRDGIEPSVSEMPDIRFQGADEILGLYNTVQLIIRSFVLGERAFFYQREGAGRMTSQMNISAEVKGGVVRLKTAGHGVPDYLAWTKAKKEAARYGWHITIGSDTSEVVLKMDIRPGMASSGALKKVTDAVNGLHFAAAHFRFDDIARFTKGLMAELEARGTAREADILTDDAIPFAERAYAEFERTFFEDIFPRLGDFMGQLHDTMAGQNHERLADYFMGNVRTLLQYASYLSDNLRGLARLADLQRRTAPDTLTPAWQTAAGRFWGIVHDIGNILGALRLSIDSAVEEGSAEELKGFNLLSVSGTVAAVKGINQKLLEIKGVNIITDTLPDIAVPRPSHVSLFRMVNELVTNATRYADMSKPERKVMVIHEIDGARTGVIGEDGVSAETDDRRLYLVIADNGVGITDAVSARAGKRLRPDLAEGTGTGLRNVAELAVREGWRFDISSDISALEMPEALRARIKGMSTAAVIVIDIAGWGGAPGGAGGTGAGVTFNAIAGYAGDEDAGPLSAGARALLSAGQAGGAPALITGTGVLIGAPAGAAPVFVPVVP